jgi:hypothetical protein
MAFKRPSRGSEPSITRRDGAWTQRRCRCARTSLAVPTRKPAPCVRATASCHVVRASSMARSTRAARRPRAARTAHRRRSRCRARMKAGDACAVLQTPRLLRWQRSGQRVARWSPSFRRGRAKQIARARTAALLRYIHVAGYTLHVARSGTLLRTRNAVQTGATKQRCSVF